MKWIISTLKAGDHIRVKRDFYFHHGVYIGNNNVIHYTGLENDSISHPENVSVRVTTIEFFARNGVVEKASLTFVEKLYKRNCKKIIEIAKSSLGEKNYDFLHNNCEDFANKCCYRKKLSSQVDEIKEKI